ISIDTIKALRDKTGISVAQCKTALVEAGGDIEKAEILLRKKSGASADKKADRTLGSGVVATYVHDGAIGAMVLLSCETDFVAKNPEFPALAREIAMQVAATCPSTIRMEHIPEEEMNKAREVFVKEVEGKPEDMKEKILEGKLKSYFQDKVLMEQPYIKDESKRVRDLITEAAQKFGERIEVSRFSRFSARG
ncbi:elongation factor Ts, partial [Candidatus Parcubacteria bacterium]|nr:elongation factor Ts [Candidatus Parcubacteria bacterium]